MWVWAKTVLSVPQKQIISKDPGSTIMTPQHCLPTLPPSHTPLPQSIGTRAIRDDRFHNVYTSREHLSYQKLHLEYPYSADGTKPYRLHTLPFYYQFALVIDKRTMEFSLLDTLYTGGILLTKYKEAGKLAISEAFGQVMPHKFVIILYMDPFHNKCERQRTPQSEPLDCRPTSIILTLCWTKHTSGN